MELNSYLLILLFVSVNGELTRGPSDVYGVKGSTVTLPCFTNLSVPVQWEFKRFNHEPDEPWALVYFGYPISQITARYRNKNKYYVTVDSTDNEYNLTIINLQINDAGTYRCIDDYGFGGLKHDEGILDHEYRAEVVYIDENLICSQCLSGPHVNQTSFKLDQYHVFKAQCCLKCFGRSDICPKMSWTLFVEESGEIMQQYTEKSDTIIRKSGAYHMIESKIEINSISANLANYSYLRCNLTKTVHGVALYNDSFNQSVQPIAWASSIRPLWIAGLVKKFQNGNTAICEPNFSRILYQNWVVGIAFADDTIFVAQAQQSQLNWYNPENCTVQLYMYIDAMKNPQGLASCLHNRALYISDNEIQCIHKVSLNDKSTEKWKLEFSNPGALSVTKEHNLLITITDKPSKVLEYSSKGVLIQIIAVDNSIEWARQTIQMVPDKLIICHGKGGSLLHRLCVLNAKGDIINSFGRESGSGEDQLNTPYSIALDTNTNVLFIADQSNKRILMFNSDLIYQGEVKTNNLIVNGSWCLNYDSNNNRLIIGDSAGRIFTITANE